MLLSLLVADELQSMHITYKVCYTPHTVWNTRTNEHLPNVFPETPSPVNR